MNKTQLRRRRALSPVVEALESRYVLDASAVLFLAPPSFGPSRLEFTAPIEITSVAPAHAPLIAPLPVQASTPSQSAIAGLPLSAVAGSLIDDVLRSESRGPFDSVRDQVTFFGVITFQSFTGSSSRSMGSSLEEAILIASANPAHSSTGSSAAGLEPSSATSAARSEEASETLASARSDAAVISAAAAARRTDSVVAAVLPATGRTDRPVPTAFATNLGADAVRHDDAHVGDASRPLPTPANLTTPRLVPQADLQESVESTSQRPPIDQVRDVFTGLLVDGFAPRLLDKAFQALKSVEANLEAPNGSGWYRLAIGCWIVAAALAYEAGRQTQNSTARALRYACASLREPEPEDER